MDVRTYLKNYVTQTTPIIEGFFDREVKKAQKISPISGDIMKRYRAFMFGGKRLRGSEILLGYSLYGGKDKKAALKASTIIEIIHAFLLIHDDIMDNDSLRRGQPTIHKQFENLHKKNFSKRDPEHFGLSMAIDTGDIGMFLASKILSSLPFPAEYVVGVHQFINDLLIDVAYGQALDVTYEASRNLMIDDVLRVHRYKCANYTVSGPLIIGALLAGKQLKDLKLLYKYGLPVGTAFQLRDDELGMFSSSEVLGKPTDSDLREGKNTVLVIYTLEHSKGEDKKFLKWAHGNPDIGVQDIERVRQIIRDSGALKYSQDLARKLVTEGKTFIPTITKDPKYRKLLSDMADFMIERDS